VLAEDGGFLGGGPKRLLVGGFVGGASSGEVLQSATGDRGGDRAIADGSAAVWIVRCGGPAAFEGPCRVDAVMNRQRALVRLADLVESNYGELGLLDTLDMGAPRRWTSVSRGTCLCCTGMRSGGQRAR